MLRLQLGGPILEPLRAGVGVDNAPETKALAAEIPSIVGERIALALSLLHADQA
jgi:hypothetical protein